ncbi:MAG: hypothetical protein C0434_08015 [Xanthomonadaceae bacterium]|nr:hypothetical protein [Xanthomonadaceae bacterium]
MPGLSAGMALRVSPAGPDYSAAGGMPSVNGNGAQISNRGLVKIKTPAQVSAEQDNSRAEAAPQPIDAASMRHTMLVGKIDAAWQRNKMARQLVDRRLLACLRMRKGVYSPDELTAIKATGQNNYVYLPIAATKCRALVSWLKEILMSPGDRPCGLEPRHLPEIPEPVRQAIMLRAQMRAQDLISQQIAAGGEPTEFEQFQALQEELADQMQAEVKLEAKKRADRAAGHMERAVFHEMDTGGWDEAFAEFLDYFSTYPTAILKGPYLARKPLLEWGPGWQPIVKTDPRLRWKAVNPFDCYPAPLARDAQDREFIERLRLSERELYEMIGVPGVDEEAVRWTLQNHNAGLLRNWIWTDAERNQLEGDTNYNWFGNEDLIDGLLYWGSVDGRTLQGWGVSGINDLDRRYEVEAIRIGNRIVMCRVNEDPLGRRPYRVASFETIPGSFWGRGVPELCESHQDIANGAARALVNNMGYASGPMVGVNIDRMPPGEDITAIFPFKIWQFNKDESGGSGAANKPLEFFQATSLAGELIQIFDAFENKADDATGIPRYSYGSQDVQGAGSTARGLSMLMGAAAKGIRRAISDIDMKVLREGVYDVFVHLMLYSNDNQIKGDCVIVPKGSTALLIKEQLQEGRQIALNMAGSTPLFAALIGKRGTAKLLQDYFKGLNLPNVLPEGHELDELIKQIEEAEAAAAQAPPPQLQVAEINNQGRLQVAQANNQSRERIAAAGMAKDLVSRNQQRPVGALDQAPG